MFLAKQVGRLDRRYWEAARCAPATIGWLENPVGQEDVEATEHREVIVCGVWLCVVVVSCKRARGGNFKPSFITIEEVKTH